jgi:hypothetical protein
MTVSTCQLRHLSSDAVDDDDGVVVVTFVDGGPGGLAFAADGGHLYVSDFGSSDVSTFVGADATAHGGIGRRRGTGRLSDRGQRPPTSHCPTAATTPDPGTGRSKSALKREPHTTLTTTRSLPRTRDRPGA